MIASLKMKMSWFSRVRARSAVNRISGKQGWLRVMTECFLCCWLYFIHESKQLKLFTIVQQHVTSMCIIGMAWWIHLSIYSVISVALTHERFVLVLSWYLAKFLETLEWLSYSVHVAYDLAWTSKWINSLGKKFWRETHVCCICSLSASSN